MPTHSASSRRAGINYRIQFRIINNLYLRVPLRLFLGLCAFFLAYVLFSWPMCFFLGLCSFFLACVPFSWPMCFFLAYVLLRGDHPRTLLGGCAARCGPLLALLLGTSVPLACFMSVSPRKWRLHQAYP